MNNISMNKTLNRKIFHIDPDFLHNTFLFFFLSVHLHVCHRGYYYAEISDKRLISRRVIRFMTV